MVPSCPCPKFPRSPPQRTNAPPSPGGNVSYRPALPSPTVLGVEVTGDHPPVSHLFLCSFFSCIGIVSTTAPSPPPFLGALPCHSLVSFVITQAGVEVETEGIATS